VQRNVAALPQGAGADGELMAAIVAQEHASRGLTLCAAVAIGAATRAGDTIGPAARLNVGECLGSVVKLEWVTLCARLTVDLKRRSK
jgi:hypothetical protein